MRALSPPPTRIEEFNQNWKNWINLFYETFAGNQLLNSETVTANSVADKKSIIYCDATAGNVTITLPAVANSLNLTYYIKKIDASVNTVIIDGNASETIDGATTKTLSSQWEVVSLHCNGSTWYLIG